MLPLKLNVWRLSLVYMLKGNIAILHVNRLAETLHACILRVVLSFFDKLKIVNDNLCNVMLLTVLFPRSILQFALDVKPLTFWNVITDYLACFFPRLTVEKFWLIFSLFVFVVTLYGDCERGNSFTGRNDFYLYVFSESANSYKLLQYYLSPVSIFT